MFCYQCQEAAGGTACTASGVCGKTADVADLQDLLVYTLSGVSTYAAALNANGIDTASADAAVTEGLFATITNANFDPRVFVERVFAGLALRERLREQWRAAGFSGALPDAATWSADTEAQLVEKAASVGVLRTENEDVRSLRELVVYGVKGMAAYAHHAARLGANDPGIYAFMHRALAATLDDSLTADELVGLVLECGKFGVDVMALLDRAHTESFGAPEITSVNLGVRGNPGILVSGHDLKDLEELLVQTEGSGVDVYTHGEMLPAHSYPAFKRFAHFVGNYGNGWWRQKEEFESFRGPVLMTTNCLVPPRDSYRDRVYTTGLAGYPDMSHVAAPAGGGPKDFSAIIAHAKRCAPPVEIEQGALVGGFAHATVLSLADTVVDAVKGGAIKRFFVMAGCDGRMKSREYYTAFAERLPADTVILTAGCAKYRYNKLDLGDIGGIPRVLDAGQCNDSYSLAVIALALKDAFGLDDVNDLPISYNIAWYEQKAVIVLLALLYLGVKNIHLGPTLPAFLSPAVASVLVERFGIAGIGAVDEDVAMFMGERDPDACAACS